MTAEPDDTAALRLRERLAAADAAITAPTGLWERVRTTGASAAATESGAAFDHEAAAVDDEVASRRGGQHDPRYPRDRRSDRGPSPVRPWRPRRRRGVASAPGMPGAPGRATGVVALAAAMVVAVVTGAWWLLNPAVSSPEPAAEAAVTLTVHNAERSCRDTRTTECALRLAENPYARYAARGNREAVVWHGDRLAAQCFVTDGTLVVDESGASSTRWYRVHTEDGEIGWLPGVRTRSTDSVPACSPEQIPPRP